LAEPQPATLRDGRTRPTRALAFYAFAAFFSDEPFEPDL
jgi:hypothetical protein